MTRVSTSSASTSEAAIFARLWETESQPLSRELAQHLVQLGFSPQDRERMHALTIKNQEDRLTAGEREELDNYIKVGDLLAILQSKARRLLRKREKTNGNG